MKLFNQVLVFCVFIISTLIVQVAGFGVNRAYGIVPGSVQIGVRNNQSTSESSFSPTGTDITGYQVGYLLKLPVNPLVSLRTGMIYVDRSAQLNLHFGSLTEVLKWLCSK